MVVNIFPGQGSQYAGMLSSINLNHPLIEEKIDQSKDILGFDIFDLMVNGSEEELRQTQVTQPAIFLHSIFTSFHHGHTPMAVAGHSLGEFSALVNSKVLDFADALELVKIRANAMQKACEQNPGSMAAILGMADEEIEKICAETPGIVVPANYNCPGQLVISGEKKAVENACETAKMRGAKRAIMLPVNGAFHSPLMKPAEDELAAQIEKTPFHNTTIPIYQNITAQPSIEAAQIKTNLLAQLTGSVKWTQSVQNMIKDGALTFIEVGPGKTLQGLISKIDKSVEAQQKNI